MKTRKLLVGILMAWGGVSLVGAMALAGYLGYALGPGNRAKVDEATVRDVRFVLNWCGLGDARTKKVIHSYESPTSITGDHLHAYAIEVSSLQVHELEQMRSAEQRWYRADQAPPILSDAIAFVGSWLHELPWFPDEAALRSSEYYVYPWSIQLHGVRPSAAALIFVRPADKMVFYFSGET